MTLAILVLVAGNLLLLLSIASYCADIVHNLRELVKILRNDRREIQK